MIKKRVKYKGLDGVTEFEDDFYFHLNQAELTEMSLLHGNDFSGYLQTIVKKQDAASIIAAFKEILVRSVGRQSDDGRRFIKNQTIIDEFMQSEAYPVLFMELVTDASASAAFIRGIVPAEMSKKLNADDLIARVNSADDGNLVPVPAGKNHPSNEIDMSDWSKEKVIQHFRNVNPAYFNNE